MRRLTAAGLPVLLTLGMAACIPTPTRTVRKQAYSIPSLEADLGLVITKESKENLRRSMRKEGNKFLYKNFETTRIVDEAILAMELTFKSVTAYDTADEAWAGGADLIADLLIDLKLDPGFAVQASSVAVSLEFKDRTGSITETLRRSVTYKGQLPPVTYAYNAAEEVSAQLQNAIIDSDAVQSLARRSKGSAMTASAERAAGPKTAPSASLSDAVRPSYRAGEDPDLMALVIGVERYSETSPARFAERDAAAVREHLLAMGCPPRNVIFLKGERAGRAAITKFIESWLPRNVTPRSKVFVYFAGNGAPDAAARRAYLLPWDGDPQYLKNTGYPLKRLYEKLSALRARQVVLALDAGFSGTGERSVLPQGARPLVTRLKETVPDSKGLAVFTAARADESAGVLADQAHGLFTYHLLKALNEKQGSAAAGELLSLLAPRISDAARRAGRSQTPSLSPKSAGSTIRLGGGR